MASDIRPPQTVEDPQDLLRLMADEIPAVLWSTDRRMRIGYCFGGGLSALDLHPEQVVGMTLLEYFQTDDPHFPPIAAHRRALRGESVSCEHAWAGRTYQTRVAPLRDGQRRVVGCTAFSQDVTERKQTDQRVEKLRAELAHMGRLKTMGEMASGMAHELNQPLAVIVMRAEAAANKLRLGRQPSEEDLLEDLQWIADEGHRAGQIVRRMRRFAQNSEPHRTTVHPTEIIDEVVSLVESNLRHAGVSLNLDVDKSLPTMLVDKIQLQQVFLNLMQNALEAMEDAEPGLRELSVRAVASNGTIEFAVCDTGCGVPHDQIDNLFDAFYSTKPDGMGMGLAISRSIIEAHNGKIWATRNAHRGSTFAFALPIVGEDQKNRT